MPQFKFYEMGKATGDWMRVLDTIEARNEWAVVLDRSESGPAFWRAFVNGVSMGPCDSQAEAEDILRAHLDGRHTPPLPKTSR